MTLMKRTRTPLNSILNTERKSSHVMDKLLSMGKPRCIDTVDKVPSTISFYVESPPPCLQQASGASYLSSFLTDDDDCTVDDYDEPYDEKQDKMKASPKAEDSVVCAALHDERERLKASFEKAMQMKKQEAEEQEKDEVSQSIATSIARVRDESHAQSHGYSLLAFLGMACAGEEVFR